MMYVSTGKMDWDNLLEYIPLFVHLERIYSSDKKKKTTKKSITVIIQGGELWELKSDLNDLSWRVQVHSVNCYQHMHQIVSEC